MPLVASLIKIAVIALPLLCVNMEPMKAAIETAGLSKAPHAQCRVYFGCMPSAGLTAGTADNDRSSR
jgi:hypothetical protein